MTVYVDRSDLEARFGQAEVAQAAWRDELNADLVITAACAGAAELVDAHLAPRYQLPLAPLPAMVKEIALDITWYKLWRGAIPDDVTARYKEATRLLARIADGTLDLQAAGIKPPESTEEGPAVMIDAPERALTRDSMRGF